jgi:pectin methylesterase-like acyl-CoA thioesterase
MRSCHGFGAALAVVLIGCNGAAPAPAPQDMSAPPMGSSVVSAGAGGRAAAVGGAGAAAISGGHGGAGSVAVMPIGGMPSSAGKGGMAGSAGSAGAGGMTDVAGAPAAGSGGGMSPPADEPQGPLFPANGARDVCPDLSLHLHFDGKPSAGSSGKISVFSAQGGAAVATVDFAAGNSQKTIAGMQVQVPRPVYVGDREIIVRLPKALDYGQHYYVTVDASAVRGPDGKALAITHPSDWAFDTRAAAPSDKSNIQVSAVGSAPYCSVQAALDALPARSDPPAVITIAAGTYYETLRVTGKSNFTLRGADRKRTVILGVNNNNMNGSTSTRSLVNIDNAKQVTLENLTIHNLTPQGGSQAEALRFNACDQCVLRHADVLSLQDTLMWGGTIYANDCYIAGNVDFIWGYGAAYFDQCEIKTVGRAGYIVQSRNDAGAYGYVFVDSKITADPGVTNIMLGRIDAGEYPGSQVAYINCQMGSHIAPAGWTITGGAAGPSLRFAEYQSTDASGAPLDVSRRAAGSMQLSADAAMKLRDPAQVLGGWTPPK